MSSESNETQQYVAIEVPHGTDSKESGMSYLRMGNLPGENESPSNIEPGDVDVMEAQGILGVLPEWTDIGDVAQMHHSFITNETDMRTGDDQEPTVEKAHWLDDLGWRDHCHGNRVSTTVGDKIEVITGNYKLVVLGGSDGSKSTGLDMSGGHTVNWAQTPGCIKRIESRGDGGWRVTWSTEDADEVRVFEGNLYEHHVGGSKHHICSYVGKGHPEITERGECVENPEPIGLIRNTAYAETFIEEELGLHIFDVVAGNTYEDDDFREDAMHTPPPDFGAATIGNHYQKAATIRAITVAEKHDEVVAVDHLTVDSLSTTTTITENCLGSYTEDFTGASRKSTTTTSSEADEHFCSGIMASQVVAGLVSNKSVAGHIDEAHLSGVRATATMAVLDMNTRLSTGPMSDVSFSSIKLTSDMSPLVIDSNPFATLTVRGMKYDAVAIDLNDVETYVQMAKVIMMFL